MGREILTLEDIELKKNKSHRNRTPIFLEDVDIEKVLVSNKISFSETFSKLFVNVFSAVCV